MTSVWLSFQGRSAEIFADLMSAIPGSDLLKLTILSAFLGVLLIWLYRFVSFQSKLLILKRRIGTIALEPFLFSDSARISLLTPLRLFGLASKYLLLSLPPLLILAGPVLWVLGLLNQVVGYSAPTQGEQMIVSIMAEKPRDVRQLQVSVEGTGFSISPLVRAYSESQAWLGIRRTDSEISNNDNFLVKVENQVLQIPLSGAPTLPVMTLAGWNRLLFPGNSSVIPAGIKEISIDFPERYFEIFGTKIPWVILFLIVSMLSGLLFAKVLKIQV